MFYLFLCCSGSWCHWTWHVYIVYNIPSLNSSSTYITWDVRVLHNRCPQSIELEFLGTMNKPLQNMTLLNVNAWHHDVWSVIFIVNNTAEYFWLHTSIVFLTAVIIEGLKMRMLHGSNSMVTNYLREPYSVYFTQMVRFYSARMAPGRRQEES